LLVLGVAVAPSPGESADRMPGIEGCVPDTAEPDWWPAGEGEEGVWLAAPLGAAAWLAVGESNRYKLYSRIKPIRFAPYSGSVAYTPVRSFAKASGTARSAMARV
jgi:hypothetical protein